MTTVQTAFVLDPRSDRFQIWRKIWYTRLENMRSSLLIFNQEDYNNKFYSSTLVYLLVYFFTRRKQSCTSCSYFFRRVISGEIRR